MNVQSLLSGAVRAADDSKEHLAQTAKRLAKQMQEIHGGDWRVEIDHGCHGFVLVVPKLGQS